MVWAPKSTILLTLLAVAVVFFGAYLWAQLQSQQQQMFEIRDQIERMNVRMDLVNEAVEAASARYLRAEENARIAAGARAEAQRETAQARQEAERIRQERQQDIDRLQSALGALVETRRTALGLVMNLGSDSIQFDFDRATLRPDNRELLSRIAGILLTAKGYSIYVYGHTDDVGSVEYNLNLSEQRARAVRDYFVDAGVDPGIISTRGYGKSSPRTTGTSAEARAANRRVEIGIVDVSMDVRGEAQ
jgi:outer membrane protein OmpA-like peptidoglycan-associated protein